MGPELETDRCELTTQESADSSLPLLSLSQSCPAEFKAATSNIPPLDQRAQGWKFFHNCKSSDAGQTSSGVGYMKAVVAHTGAAWTTAALVPQAYVKTVYAVEAYAATTCDIHMHAAVACLVLVHLRPTYKLITSPVMIWLLDAHNCKQIMP